MYDWIGPHIIAVVGFGLLAVNAWQLSRLDVTTSISWLLFLLAIRGVALCLTAQLTLVTPLSRVTGRDVARASIALKCDAAGQDAGGDALSDVQTTTGGCVTLVLFDIDGTLVRGAPPVHRKSLCDAAQVIFGVTLTSGEFGPTAGMTDSAIARRELLAAGVSDAEISAGLAAFCAAAADAYERRAPDDLRAYHTPHALATLDWLSERGVTLGLVTGNIERIAWRKLSAAGLASRFVQPRPLEGASWTVAPWIGGFGDQGEDRATLPPLALASAARLIGARPLARDTWVIGDTPADISCGAAHGLRAIAVATGPAYSLDDLRTCGPDAVLSDLSELRDTLFALDDESA